MPTNYVATLAGEQLLVTIGDGNATVETFTMPALINTQKSFTVTQNVESDEINDLNNLSNAAVMVRRTRSIDMKIDGSGLIHQPDTYQWLTWAATGGARNCKITQMGNAAAGGWTVTVPMVCTNFQITGSTKKSTEASITLELAGAFTLTKNP